MVEEELLIKRCTLGEYKAQKELYDKYSALLMGICIRYAQDRSSAEDILQEAFVKIFLCIKDYNALGSFEGWMKRIVINTAITYYHKNIKHLNHFDIDEMYDIPDEDYKYNNSDFTHEELLNVINQLPQGYKMVFNLFAIEGFKHREIADMLNIDINTSKTQFLRARKFIIKKLNILRNCGDNYYE
ncbi:MAG: sigma-70 family RNA polymerase sigma factor [Bacteroidales bacterium]|nr:sigma-70 family RNA polymerase sigma factor [Bacteroidales bacterium]